MNKSNSRIMEIKELRERTKLSIMKCKKALDLASGDVEKAFEILMNLGAVNYSESAVLKEGCIGHYCHHNRKCCAIVELRCQTDFTAKNESFVVIANNLAMHIVQSDAQSILELMKEDFVCGDSTVEEVLKNTSRMFGENVEVRNFYKLTI